MIYLGVDGGGTKTRAVAVDGEGRVLFQGTYPSSYLPALGEEGLRRLLQGIVDHLPALPQRSVLGLGGYGEVPVWDAAYQRVAREVLGEVRLLNDVELAWWAAFDGAEGVVVIAGTGSMAYGKGPRGVGRAGGFGPLFGDEGSAYWIGLEALRYASKGLDGRLPPTGLIRLPRLYGKGDLLELLDFLQSDPSLLRGRVAALAQEVDRMAEEDWAAREVLERAAEELALLGLTLAERLGARALSPMGGVFRSLRVREGFARRVAARGKELKEPRQEPALKGAEMARDGVLWEV